MSNRLICGAICLACAISLAPHLAAAEPVSQGLFGRKNLVAWCIVPFDSKKRGPEERAAMLEKLGFTHFAYDYRAEHIPTFDAEIEALQRHHVELSAWWFPTTLNDEAKMTLAIFARHKVTPQLWVTGGGGPAKDAVDQRQRVIAEAARIRPIAEAAAKVGCKVALYNHGGWFGEPENQIEIIRELKLDNVGIVYNLHHGHDHLDRFADLLQKMKPYLYTLNLNGMVQEGDRKGQKILQLGEGDLDLKLLKIIRDSGYTGPIGILGHTQDDAEERLHDNLDGLDWLLPQLNGQEAGPRPKMRTPVPRAGVPVVAPATSHKPLVDGKFGQGLDGRAGGAFVAGREEFRRFPITVECWTKLAEKSTYNILVANELKSSGTHWEVFSMAGTGQLTAYVPGFSPDHCRSTAMICDNQWHHIVMILEPQRIRLLVDGKIVADQAHQRTNRPSEAGGLALASLVDRAIGCSGQIDEVRISSGVRSIDAIPDKPFVADETTIALWHLDELVEKKRFDDAAPLKNAALLGDSRPMPAPVRPAATGKIEGHWGEDAIGFRWTESDSRDERVGMVDGGPFFSGSITGPGGPVYKGIVVRLGDQRESSILYDTELLRVAAGWNGFLKFDPARFGVIVPPKIDGPAVFSTPRFPGISFHEQFENYRESHPFGPLPKPVAHYEGLFRHGNRVVVKYAVGTGLVTDSNAPQQHPTTIFESPWLETHQQVSAITRTLLVSPSAVSLRLMIADNAARTRLHPQSDAATLLEQPGIGQVLVIPARAKPATIKLLLSSPDTNESAFDQLVAHSPAPEDLLKLMEPAALLWGEPLITRGELGKVDRNGFPYAVDTIALPFQNRFNALFFCAGHDFFSDGRAAVCTLHGDVWVVDGIDATLQRLTWRRFATGLFQPLGLKIVNGTVFVVGRDQITRLTDLNNDGEADSYENFNNDAHVTLNGHEYVTCLETDRAGNFYYVKGNCNSQTPHDGSVLRVSADGSKLDVFATGFRNPNGIGMGPNDELTVAPQEGEWTPASAVFLVREGGFYGGMMSHHRAVPPTDFERPLVWFPRLADNSSGGQVWTTSDRFGPLSNQLMHLSYGQCRLRLVLRDSGRLPAIAINGASIELPIRFLSGIHRGRMNPGDGQLYLTGLKGWTTSAVDDGCFQRVRYTGQPVDVPIAMQGFKNGVALTWASELDPEAAEEPSNYHLQAWNYKWSAAYGSPDYKPSAPGQIGRDEIEVTSATLLKDRRTLFLEIPGMAPVDQLSIDCTLLSKTNSPIEQSVVMTFNAISPVTFQDEELHRPRTDPERERMLAALVPGVVRLRSPGTPNAAQSVLRMIAWNDLRAADAGPRSSTVSGWLRVPTTGIYRFSAWPWKVGTRISVGKQGSSGLTDDGIELSLGRGLHPIKIDISSDDGQFRLMWESSRFPREAIPATHLLHSPLEIETARLRETGAVLFHRFRCGNCHEPSSLKNDEGSDQQFDTHEILSGLRSGPRLNGVGARLRTDWLTEWIRHPHRLRNETTMPAVLPIDDVVTAADIAAYLGTLRETEPITSDSPTIAAAAAKTGADLFERLGCIACHTLARPDQADEWMRVSLHFVNAKYHPSALYQYLKAPHAHHPSSRMPDFHLSNAEAASLAAFLQREAVGRLETTGSATTGQAVRGRLAFEKFRCNSCHTVDPASRLARPEQPAIFHNPAAAETVGGCLADAASRESRSHSPGFNLSSEERSALSTFCRSQQATVADDTMVTSRAITHWMTQLRCQACHVRDEHRSLWPEIIVDEGSGRQSEPVPQLTWVGEKLQGPWVERFLKGEIPQKPRPWLTARMPAFPAYARLLAHGMANEHGVPFQEAAPVAAPDANIELGRRLTLRDGGLDCRQCHGVGREQPRSDAATQIALGINFALTRQRLRPEFAVRQMLDPPRYDVGSRMPRFAPDLKTTSARQIEAGNAVRQFELLKDYLWSIRAE